MTDHTPGASRRAEVVRGVRASFAAGLGMYPLGVAFGLLVVQAGLPWWLAPALSLAAFAGSLELLLVGMIATGTSLLGIAATTLVVNFRHVFYAFSFLLHVVRHPLARAYSVYALTDEAYAMTAVRPGSWTSWRLLAMQLCFQLYWVGGGLTGVAIASLMPGPIDGLEFALCALFITLTLDAARSGQDLPSLLLGAGAFAVAVLIAPDSVLFVGLLLFVAFLVVRHLTHRGGAHA